MIAKGDQTQLLNIEHRALIESTLLYHLTIVLFCLPPSYMILVCMYLTESTVLADLRTAGLY